MPAVVLAAYVAGMLALQLSPVLPGFRQCLFLGLIPLGAMVAAVATRSRWMLPLAAVMTGIWWAAVSGAALLAQRPELPPRGVTTTVVVRILDFPQSRGIHQRLLAEVVSSDAGPAVVVSGARLRISDYGQGRLYRPGETWRLTLRLRAARGLRNPGVFDYETWLFRQNIVATGYVREDSANGRLEAAPWGLARLRGHLAQNLERALADHPHAGLIRALALGDQGAVTSEQWRVFRDTGTSHIAVVSGQHILMASAPVYALTRWLWPRLPAVALRLAAPRAGAIALLGAGGAYGLLAGFSVPVQRALLMMAAFVAALWWRRERSGARLLLTTLALVLTLDPRAALAPGTWLSFGAVGCLYAGFGGRLGRWRGLSALVRAQWLVTLGLAPLLLLAFGRLSWVAPAANLILVPVFSVLLLPLILAGTLLGALFPALATPLLGAAATTLSVLWTPWAGLASWPVAASSLPMLDWIGVGMMIGGTAWLLAPRGTPGRIMGALLVVLALIRPGQPIEPGVVEATLLDVGQGQALVLRTARHVLLYDTGPRMGDTDAVEWVIEPYLRSEGIDRVDRVIVSHDDIDHSGGAVRLRQVMAVREWLGGGEHPFPGTRPCRSGETWRWDGVMFEVLYPPAGYRGSDNEGSCVLQITAPGGRMLVMGDLERRGERILLEQGADVRADVLIAGHHGSAGASSATFLSAVAPQWTLIAAGYGNRWNFPARAVRQRLDRQGSEWLATGEAGAVQVRLDPEQGIQVVGWRCGSRRYWHLPVECGVKE